MMNITPLSQRDSRWGNKTLGFSRLRIKDYGCTLTALTVLINCVYGTSHTPDYVNNELKKVQAFSGALIWWSRVPRAFPKLKWITRGYNYWNPTVAWYVYWLKMPVMVEVNGAAIGGFRHWVLYLGGQKAMDPWTGTLVSTSKYPATGYATFQKR